MGELSLTYSATGSQGRMRKLPGRNNFWAFNRLRKPTSVSVIQVCLLLLLLSGENLNSMASPSKHFINWLLLGAHLHLPNSSLLLKVGATGHTDITSEHISNPEFQSSLLNCRIRIIILIRTLGDSCAYESLRSIALATVKDLTIFQTNIFSVQHPLPQMSYPPLSSLNPREVRHPFMTACWLQVVYLPICFWY